MFLSHLDELIHIFSLNTSLRLKSIGIKGTVYDRIHLLFFFCVDYSFRKYSLCANKKAFVYSFNSSMCAYVYVDSCITVFKLIEISNDIFNI